MLVAQPATGTAATASPGKKVAIDELVLRMPHGMRDRARTMTNANEDIYVYATDVK